MAHSKRKNKSTETVSEKYLKDLLDKDSKTTVLKKLKELKESCGEVKKTMCEQNANIDQEKT